MIRRTLLLLLALLAAGCTESVIGYQANGDGTQLATLDVEVGAATPYLLMDYDQSKDPTLQTATDAHSFDPSIADVERTGQDAPADMYAGGHVFAVYGHVAGETDFDVFHDGHHVGTIHVRVTNNRGY